MEKQKELCEYEDILEELTPEEQEQGTKSLLAAIVSQQRRIDHSMCCINAEMKKEIQDV